MKTSKHRRVRPYKRKIHLGRDVFSYRIGAGGRIIQIRSPLNTMTFNLDSYELHDTTYDEWHGTDDYYGEWSVSPPRVTPALIKEFIEKNCLTKLV